MKSHSYEWTRNEQKLVKKKEKEEAIRTSMIHSQCPFLAFLLKAAATMGQKRIKKTRRHR